MKLFGHTFPFFLYKNNLKNWIFRDFWHLRNPLVATFNERHVHSSRKYVVEPGIWTWNSWKALQTFWLHSSVFSLEKIPEKINLQSYLHVRIPLVANFNESRAPSLRKYVAEEGIPTTNWSKLFKILNITSSFLLYKNNLKNKICRAFLPLKNPLMATSNETCAPTPRKKNRWRGYSPTELIKYIWNFLVELLGVCFTKISEAKTVRLYYIWETL